MERSLALGAGAIIIIVGGGLIALLWGLPAFLAALSCFGGVLVLGAGLWLVLKLMEWAARDRG